MKNRSSYTRLGMMLRWLLALSLVVIPVSAAWAAPAQQTVPPDLEAAVRAAAAAFLGQPPPERLVVADVQLADGWASGQVIKRAAPGEDDSPRIVLFLARQGAGGWEVTLNSDPVFPERLAGSPTGLLPGTLREPRGDAGIASANSSVNLSFPFAAGERLLFNGPHDDHSNPRSAIDFTSLDSPFVRAAADGVVIYNHETCPNYVQVWHQYPLSDNFSTGYYHLTNEEQYIWNGKHVVRGEILGLQSEAIGCGGSANGDHVHFSLIHNSAGTSLHGHNIGGWTVEAGTRPYEGCLIRESDNARNCSGTNLTNQGLTGGGPSNGTRFWIFNNSTLGWGRAGLVETDFDYSTSEPLPAWFAVGDDPRLFSPLIAPVPAATYPYFFVRMSTTNDICGTVWFRRQTDADFDPSRRVDFDLTYDGAQRNYLIDMRANPNWNGSITQLRFDPGCGAGGGRIVIARIELLSAPPAQQNLIRNPSFYPTLSEWNFRNVNIWLLNGKFTIQRTVDDTWWSAVHQDLNAGFPAGAPFEASIRLGNDASSPRQVSISLHDFDSLADALTCTFTLPPSAALQTYNLRGKTNAVWRNPRFEINVLTQSGTADVVADDVAVTYRPDIAVEGGVCGQFPAAPALKSPAGGAELTAIPALAWNAVSGAVRYELQFGAANPPPTVSSALTGTTFTPGWVDLGVPQYWRVRAIGASGQESAWSETRVFQLVSAASAAPTLGVYETATPTLTWNAVTWAVGYEVQVSRSAAFQGASSYVAEAGALSKTLPDALEEGMYYWRVRAQKTATTWGGWSAAERFVVDLP